MLKQLARIELPSRGKNGTRRKHHRFGKVLLYDCMRVRAPVDTSIRSLKELRARCDRYGMHMVHISAYRHGDQWDIVIGWKIAVIVDQSTGLPLVGVLVPANWV